MVLLTQAQKDKFWHNGALVVEDAMQLLAVPKGTSFFAQQEGADN
jgi:hypothetical protein